MENLSIKADNAKSKNEINQSDIQNYDELKAIITQRISESEKIRQTTLDELFA